MLVTYQEIQEHVNQMLVDEYAGYSIKVEISPYIHEDRVIGIHAHCTIKTSDGKEAWRKLSHSCSDEHMTPNGQLYAFSRMLIKRHIDAMLLEVNQC